MDTVITSYPAGDGTAAAGGLTLARERITAARSRGEVPSDGGSTGRSDQND